MATSTNRKRATDADVEQIVSRLQRYVGRDANVAHDMRQRLHGTVEYAEGARVPSYFLDEVHYASTYQLARFFVPSLPQTSNGGSASRKRGRDASPPSIDEQQAMREQIAAMQRQIREKERALERGLERERALREQMAAQMAAALSRRSNEEATDSLPPIVPPERHSDDQAQNDVIMFDAIEGGGSSSHVQDVATQVLQMLHLPVVDEITISDVEALFDKRVSSSIGQNTVPFRTLCNFEPDSVLTAFSHRGATVCSSIEQSQKTFLLVALAALASMKKRPCVLVVGLSKPATNELETKMRVTLQSLGIVSSFLANEESAWSRFTSDITKVNEFREGRRLIISPGYATGRMSFIEEVDANDVLVLMDESDVVFASDNWTRESKDGVLARVIGRPQDADSRVTGIALVSATHLGDMHLWNKVIPDVPKTFIEVDLDLLKERGFTTHHEMDLIDTVDIKCANKTSQYGLDTPGFRYLTNDFVTCPGTKKLMLIASCPRVNAGDSTLFTQADFVLRLDPEALVVVHYSGRSFFVRRDSQGVNVCQEMVFRGTNTGRPKKVKTIGDALELLQARYARHDDRRFVVVGYNALQRSSSTRTSDMVPTHMFALMGKGRHTADVRQTMMRPAGRSTQVRTNNGHGHVKVVTPEEDWEMVTVIYELQVAIAEKMTNDSSFDFETFEGYGIDAASVVNTSRLHARPKVKLDGSWRVDATEDEWREAQRVRVETRRAREQRKEDTMRRSEVMGSSSASVELPAAEAEAPEAAADDNAFVEDGAADEYEGIGAAAGDNAPPYTATTRTIVEHQQGQQIDILIRAMAATAPVAGSFTRFASDQGVDITSHHRYICYVMRSRGLMTAVGVSPVALTRLGCDYAVEKWGADSLSEFYKSFV